MTLRVVKPDCPHDRIEYTPSGRPFCDRYGLSTSERLAAIIAPPICFAFLCCTLFYLFLRFNTLRRRLCSCEERLVAADAALAAVDAARRKDRDLFYAAGWTHGRYRESRGRECCPHGYPPHRKEIACC